ncbi:MAG: peptide chain release factor N(5)-glutamine methyltransferase [Kiritimatiellia bacterium]|nr:peptide chain release factor N(5)-glutamine methyltransferase [Lentisphaerota bacterium]
MKTEHPTPQPTVREFILQAATKLRRRHPAECRLLAELLLGMELGCARWELALRQSEPIPPRRLPRLQRKLETLSRGIPWQHLAGKTEFFGRSFRCDRRALIPRPETEQLVTWILEHCITHATARPVIAEAGVGSGCIIITLALELPEANCLGTDISDEALTLAIANARARGVAGRIRFSRDDFLSSLPSASLDMVVANPPYVTSAEYRRLPAHIRCHEPLLALDGGPDGMNAARRLAPQAARCLRPGGWIYLEFAPGRMRRLRKILDTAGFAAIATGQDYHGRSHFMRACKK